MESMGIHVGCDLRVVHSGDGRGKPALVAVGETRLAIGHDMLDNILVAVDS
jgi:Fe2+ transport system protein FeoA